MSEKKKFTKEERKRQIIFRTTSILAVVLVCAVAGVVLLAREKKEKVDPKYIPPVTEQESLTALSTGETEQESEAVEASTVKEPFRFEAHMTDKTAGFAESVVSERGILIDVESGEILAAKASKERMSPASMTKILTVLVAAEHLDEKALEDTFVMTGEIKGYSYAHDCSDTGFEVDEVIPVKDLFYGTILPSGADAALGLATYVAGSPEAFVEMMNEKLKEMGLSETTHFTNCIGLYDENHYSTCYDMAMILKAASDNAWCREVMSEHKHTTSATVEHPEGIMISNWFLRRIEDYDTHGLVLCAKTGFVNQSGSCAASLALDKNQKEYICVTAGSTSSWRCIYDQIDLYAKYLPE